MVGCGLLQNIKNLVGNFWAIYVGIMHAKFKPPSFTGMGGGGGDRFKEGRTNDKHSCNEP